MMITSLKMKIVLYYMLVMGIILSVLGGIIYFALNRVVYNSVDNTLLAEVMSLSQMIDDEEGDVNTPAFSAILSAFQKSKTGHYYQITDAKGKVLKKTVSLGNRMLPVPEKWSEKTFNTIHLKNRRYRLVSFNYQSKEPAEQPINVRIQCAVDIENVYHKLLIYKMIIMAGLALVAAIASLGGFFIAHRALAPINQISEIIDRISVSSLAERIMPDHYPQEIKPLALAFNRTFDRLGKSFEQQKQFVADASHELRTPLSVVLSQSELTLKKKRTLQAYRDALNTIRTSALFLTGMVEKLVFLARFDAEQAALTFEPVNIKALVDRAGQLVGILAERQGVKLTVESEKTAYMVYGDEAALLELLVNILDNAVKYNRPGGHVNITLCHENRGVTIKVADSGRGIAKQDREKVFDRFFRTDQSLRTAMKGMGLGLSICREIVKTHKGRLTLDSEPGRGTTVCIFLNTITGLSGQQL